MCELVDWRFSCYVPHLAGCVVTRSVSCQIAGCQRDVLASLSAQGVCLGHYLEMVFVRLETALDLCQRSKPVDFALLDWLFSQGDFAAQALAKGGGAIDPTERTRLLELLLCLANLHEYAKHHSIEQPIEAAPSERPGEETRDARAGGATRSATPGRTADAQ